MTTKRELDSYQEPAPRPLTAREWVFYAVAFALIYLELDTMWLWCQWFTLCPRV